MPSMIDMIRSSSVPATLMQAAARGALSVTPAETIEILVYLANHNKVFGQQARMTLAGWDESASLAVAADPKTPPEVLEYFVAPENLRPALLPALLENPSVSDTNLSVLAATGPREVVSAMRQSPRVQRSPVILHSLTSNANATQSETAQMHEQLTASGFESESTHVVHPDGASVEEHDEAVSSYFSEHANEIAADEGKPFQPLGGMYELEALSGDTAQPVVSTEPAAQNAPPQDVPVGTHASPPDAAVVTGADTNPASPSTTTEAAATAAVAPATAKTPRPNPEAERGSVLQRIARLDIKGRIQMAMKGSKEERSILIRDGTKLVALAVLESGKITDGEVEKFASQKNVLEAVLRQIPMKRRFMKNYNVVRNLVANPRTPIDVSLGLMKNLLVADLRNLASNKEVSETIRKLALKMFKLKSDTSKKQ
jgi:hypothetical protein